MLQDFSDPYLVSDGRHMAHQTTHPSGMPLTDAHVATWPIAIEAAGDRYAKRVRTLDDDGQQGTMLLPMFNRLDFLESNALIPSLYMSPGKAASHDLRASHRWSILDFAKLCPADDDPLFAELGLRQSASNPLLQWTHDRITYVVDSVAVLEAMIANDEPMFRLLLSPFRDIAVQVRRVGDEAAIYFPDAMALRPRGEAFRKVHPTRYDSIEDALCLAYWLGSTTNVADLSFCVESIRRKAPLRLPLAPWAISVGLRGYERGSKVLVASIRRIENSASCPSDLVSLTVLDQRAGRGRVYPLRPHALRPDGTLRRLTYSSPVEKLGAEETEVRVRAFKEMR
jgi:hypothetical protein